MRHNGALLDKIAGKDKFCFSKMITETDIYCFVGITGDFKAGCIDTDPSTNICTLK